ncbi:hypothetical protein JKP88DRAFT_353969 [Tribonema minus]|uniref:Uncharacterized protein n=1 Tax=Tribonema minus TaxID=303371 RepID=A0A835Z9K2_9STRA|nr:hypothetical protein JKP88DRAFT_353969 [Tribonema minus]
MAVADCIMCTRKIAEREHVMAAFGAPSRPVHVSCAIAPMALLDPDTQKVCTRDCFNEVEGGLCIYCRGKEEAIKEPEGKGKKRQRPVAQQHDGEGIKEPGAKGKGGNRPRPISPQHDGEGIKEPGKEAISSSNSSSRPDSSQQPRDAYVQRAVEAAPNAALDEVADCSLRSASGQRFLQQQRDICEAEAERQRTHYINSYMQVAADVYCEAMRRTDGAVACSDNAAAKAQQRAAIEFDRGVAQAQLAQAQPAQAQQKQAQQKQAQQQQAQQQQEAQEAAQRVAEGHLGSERVLDAIVVYSCASQEARDAPADHVDAGSSSFEE